MMDILHKSFSIRFSRAVSSQEENRIMGEAADLLVVGKDQYQT